MNLRVRYDEEVTLVKHRKKQASKRSEQPVEPIKDVANDEELASVQQKLQAKDPNA